MPPMDTEGDRWLEVVNITWDGEWTSVTFLREGKGDDDSVSVRWRSTLWVAGVIPVRPQPSTPTAWFDYHKYARYEQ